MGWAINLPFIFNPRERVTSMNRQLISLLAPLALAMALPMSASANNLLDQVKQGAATLQHGKPNAKEGHTGAGAQASAPATCPAEAGLRSTNGQHSTQIKFVNDGPQPLSIFWLDYQGKRVFYKTIPSRASHQQQTFVTHPWVIVDEQQRCQGVYFPDDRERTVVLR